MAAEGGGRQARGFPSFVFLGWTRPGVYGALPWALPWALSWNSWNRRGLCAGAEPGGGSGAPSLENSPFQSCLGVGGAISGGQMDWMPHHAGPSMKCPQRDCELGSHAMTLPVRPLASVQPFWASVRKIIIMPSSYVVMKVK